MSRLLPPKADSTPKANNVIPEPVDLNLGLCALTIKATCGDCRHFDRMPHPAYEIVCKRKGIIEKSKPCARFSPDTRRINFESDEMMLEFAKMLATIPDSKLPVIASLANREHRTRKRGYFFGERVYLKAHGGDYISNYRACRVISADPNYIHIEGADGFIASVLHGSVLNMRQWKRKKAELELAKRIKDPQYTKYFMSPTKAERDLRHVMRTKDAPVMTSGNTKGQRSVLAHEDASKKKVVKKRVLFNANIVDPHTTAIDTLLKVRGSA